MDTMKHLVEIRLPDSENFLKVKETLTRIGIASNKEMKLYQTCHILHKRGRYYLMHFKELFALDGKDTEYGEEDMARRNAIAKLLEEWGLIDIVDYSMVEEPSSELSKIRIISFKEKQNWKLIPKYSIGTR
jgi:hypothetical protein